jgi:predicted transcriptional regulator
MRTTAITAFILLMPRLCAAQTTTLHDVVRDNDASSGTLSIMINRMSPTRELATVLSDSDLVVEGILDRSEARLARDQRSIETVFDLGVTRVLSQNVVSTPVPRAAIKQLKIIQQGGEAIVDGRTVTVSVSDFPVFQVGRHLVLFLKKQIGEPDGVFWIVDGPNGSFDVVAGQIFSVAKLRAPILHAHDGADVDSFAAVLDSLTRK